MRSRSGNRGATLNQTAISRALAAKGLTDAQARAIIAGALSLLEGLQAVGVAGGVSPKVTRPTLVGLGDSRVPTFIDKATMRQKGGGDPLNNLCALALQKYRVIGDFGKSGQTPQQFLTQLPDVIALNPGVVWMPSVLNSVGEDIPTASTSGTDSADRMIAAAETLRQNGIFVVFGSEVGKTGLSVSKRAQTNEYNRRIIEYCDQSAYAVFADLRPQFCDANNLVRVEFTYDGIHWNGYGAFEVAKFLKPIFDQLMPAAPAFTLDANGQPQVAGYTNVLTNRLFATATGGSTTTGATGTFSGGTRYQKTTNATLAATSVSGSTRIQGTFAASNDDVRISQEIANTLWAPGDVFCGGALVTLNAPPTNLAGIQFEMIAYGDQVFSYSDMVATPTWAGPNGTFQMLLLTQDYVMPSPTNRGVLQALVRARGYLAGNVDFTVTQIGLFKKNP